MSDVPPLEKTKLRLSRESVHGMLRDMMRIRRFETKCAQLYTEEKIRGFLHLYDGEEAIAVGVMAALHVEDRVVSTYREHGHALARGVSMGSALAEMFGKANGCSGGRGGSMHLFDRERNFYGGNAIVGGGLPLATGLALGDSMLKAPHITVCFFGEGAAAEGEFHEALNLAALRSLPVLFVCENNRYAMGTEMARVQSVTSIRDRAVAYGIQAESIDGMDVVAEFGEERIRDTPLSESGFTGAGIGAALTGMRPIVELMTVNFSLLALDQIVNTAAALRHMSGGQFGVPLVIRMTTGAGKQLAAQHSHSLEGWYTHIPGLRILTPATVADARGMLLMALREPDPVLIFENVILYNHKGELDENAGAVDIERAALRRRGADLSLITYGGSLYKVLEAAEQLASEGIEAEVIDLRVLRPLDDDTIMASVRRTRRAVIVDEGWRSGSLAAEISARITEQCFWELDAPVGRLCSEEVPIPYARHLEVASIPQVPGIVAAAHAVMGEQP